MCRIALAQCYDFSKHILEKMSATAWLRTIKESLKVCGPVPDNSVPTLSGGSNSQGTISEPFDAPKPNFYYIYGNFQGSVSDPFDIPDPHVYPTYGVAKTYSERAQDMITSQLLCRPDPSVDALRKRLGLE